MELEIINENRVVELEETFKNEDLLSLLSLIAPNKKDERGFAPRINYDIVLSKREFSLHPHFQVRYSLYGTVQREFADYGDCNQFHGEEFSRALSLIPDQYHFRMFETHIRPESFAEVISQLPNYFQEYLLTHIEASIGVGQMEFMDLMAAGENLTFLKMDQGLRTQKWDYGKYIGNEFSHLDQPQLIFTSKKIHPEIKERTEEIEALVNKIRIIGE